jgi:predicted  nucleic acid-binding Zn-ribbon protein
MKGHERMHPDLEKLIVLQGLDIEARRLQDEIAALPKRVAELATKVGTARTELNAIVEKLGKEEALRRRLELAIKEHQGKAARLRKQMDIVTTTAQANALEHEISFAESEISRLEDEELESMERSEQLEATKVDAEQTLANTERHHAEQSGQAAETLDRDRLALSGVETQRGQLRPEIGENALSMYDRIVKAKGTGLAEGVDQKCSACQMIVRPQRWNDLRDRSNDELMLTCESCGRLLYWDPARDAPQKKTVKNESIAASIVRASL